MSTIQPKTKLKINIPNKIIHNLYEYVFHFNEYEDQMYAIHRDYYVKYFENKNKIPKGKLIKVESYV
jgi:hypothetical protein